MVGAVLNVGAGNLDTHVIAQKLAMGSKDGPGEIVMTSWSIHKSDPSSCDGCLSLIPATAPLLRKQYGLMPLLSFLHSRT